MRRFSVCVGVASITSAAGDGMISRRLNLQGVSSTVSLIVSNIDMIRLMRLPPPPKLITSTFDDLQGALTLILHAGQVRFGRSQ